MWHTEGVGVFAPLHVASLHFTSLDFTSLHFTSFHFTSLHFTSLHFLHIRVKCCLWIPFEFTVFAITVIINSIDYVEKPPAVDEPVVQESDEEMPTYNDL